MVLTEAQELQDHPEARDLLDNQANQAPQVSQAALVAQDLLAQLAIRDLKVNRELQVSLAAQAQSGLLEDQARKAAQVPLEIRDHLADRVPQDQLVHLELMEQ